MTSRRIVAPRQTGNGATAHLAEIPAPTSLATPSTEPDGGRRFGVGTASALVVGSVIGTGVFALPSALAELVETALNGAQPTPAAIGGAVATVLAPTDPSKDPTLGTWVPWWTTFVQTANPTKEAVALLNQIVLDTVEYMRAGYATGVLPQRDPADQAGTVPYPRQEVAFRDRPVVRASSSSHGFTE